MNVYVSNWYRLAKRDHDLLVIGFLTGEHRRMTTRGDNDLICGHYQKILRAGCNEIVKGK